MKALHGMLPTATRLHVTRPDLYHNDLCARCLQEPETADHLWQCQHAQMVLAKIEEEGTDRFWQLAAVEWPGLRAARSTAIFPGPNSITEVVRGIVPLEWVTLLCACGLSLVKARSVAARIGKFIVSAAHDQIWCPCCDAQVMRERSLLVTQRAKTHSREHITQHSCRAQLKSRVTHISRTLAGFCQMCQLSFVDHPLGACPSLLSQAPFLADSLLHRHHRSLCILPSILNLYVALRVLDSTGGDTMGS